MSEASALRVVRPGLLTTVQDRGRWGHQRMGIAEAGPMDPFSHHLANWLVGNGPYAATLECTLIGPHLEVLCDLTLAVAGAEFDLTLDGSHVPMHTSWPVRAGQVLAFGRRHQGARAYIAVSGGGVLTPLVYGSRATHLPSAMGGLDGRVLHAGDVLPVSPGGDAVRRRAGGLVLPSSGRARLRIMPGAEAPWFTTTAWQTLTHVSFQVSPRSNRMGYRMEGPPLPLRRHDALLSEAVARGTVQVPPSGEPILLMADHQTTGGYPRIAHVISADACMAGQLAPGDFVEWVACGPDDALEALRAREHALAVQTGGDFLGGDVWAM
ncbi:MAG: biotin-dependent carboxyltransferase family protein [Acidobacteria bacterium]|nr:biotin-dependent carboxyltransferase family protein [Acidobacteriota bacterium]